MSKCWWGNPHAPGSFARSVATAEVMILFGPPTRQPMSPKSASSRVTGSCGI